jgi:hypothetical protein
MLLPLCGESEDHPVLRASFGGIADDGSPVELKVPVERTFATAAYPITDRQSCLIKPLACSADL